MRAQTTHPAAQGAVEQPDLTVLHDTFEGQNTQPGFLQSGSSSIQRRPTEGRTAIVGRELARARQPVG